MLKRDCYVVVLTGHVESINGYIEMPNVLSEGLTCKLLIGRFNGLSEFLHWLREAGMTTLLAMNRLLRFMCCVYLPASTQSH